MLHQTRIAYWLSTVAVGLLCALPVRGDEGTVHIQLRWLHQFQFAGYYAALEQGYYRDEGLRVEIHPGSPRHQPVTEVLAGRAHYGVGNSEVLYQRLDGKPLVALAAILQHSPSVLLTRADAGIRNVHDLIGKRVMLMNRRQDADFITMLLNEGVNLEQVEIVPSSFDIQDLVRGKVDAFNSYLTNEPYFLKERGIPYEVISPQSYRVDFYSDILFTSEKELRRHPERAAAMRRASLKGWRYAMDHPEAVIRLLVEEYGVEKSIEHLRFEAAEMRKLMLPDLIEIGHMNPQRWRHMADTFVTAGLAKANASLAGFLYDPAPRALPDWAKMALGGALLVIVFILVVLYLMLRFNRRLHATQIVLAENEERLRVALKVAKQAWFEVEVPNGRIHVSPDYPEMLGYDPRRFDYNIEEWQNTIHPEDLPRLQAVFEEIGRTGEPQSLVYRRGNAAGEWRWFQAVGSLSQRDGAGRPLRITGILTDISERKEHEQRLRRAQAESQEQNQRLAALNRIGMLANVTPELGTILERVLTQVREIFASDGASYWELIEEDGALICRHAVGIGRDVIQGQRLALGEGIIGDAAKRGVSERVVDSRRDSRHHSVLDMISGIELPALLYSPLVHNGRLLGMLSVVDRRTGKFDEFDLTFLESVAASIAGALTNIRLLEQSRRLRDQAEAANQAKSQFLANMSHEIRTPMNAIIGLSRLALEMELGERQRDLIEKVCRSGGALLGIINDILDFSRIEANRLELESTHFDLRTVLDNVDNLIGYRAREKGLKWRIEVAAGTPRVLRGDPLRIGQILLNLGGNAVKFTEQGGITVRVWRVAERDAFVRLGFEVEDSGVGMGVEQKEKLFKPFTQADSSVTRRYGGSGLGLVICKKLVGVMGGRITLDSSPQQGTRVSFDLLLKAGDPRYLEKLEDEVNPDIALEGARILLAEDNSLNREVAQGLLESVGVEVEWVENGEQAVAAVARGDYDAVLMDLQMPVMDGYSATRAIRELGKSVPVLAMTAHAMSNDREKCLAAGMDDHVAKPIEPRKLYASLQRWVRPREGGRDAADSAPRPLPGRADSPAAGAADELPCELPGIDQAAGLSYMNGDRHLYRRLLTKFIHQFSGFVAEMERDLQAGDQLRAARAAHTLKGVAGSLGMPRLSEAAVALDEAFKAHDRGRIDALLAGSLREALEEILAGLEGLASGRRESVPAATEGPADPALFRDLDEWRQLLAKGEFGAVDVFLKLKPRLSPWLPPPALGDLEQAMEAFDFDGAGRLVDAFRDAVTETGEVDG